MSTGRRILIAVAALAVPTTSVVLFGTPAMFAGASAPEFPVACKLTATVTFNPPLTQTGTHTTDRSAVTTMTISAGHLSGCLSSAPAGAPGHGTLTDMTVNLPATSIGRIGGVKTYATGYCPSFSGPSTLKALRGSVFNISWTGGEVGSSAFTTKKATTATNSDSEFGFTLAAKQGVGSYSEKSLNQITAFFDAADSPALASGCSAAQTVSVATFDASNSTVIL
jgi:hypothetical protein